MAFFTLDATQLGVALGSRTRPGSLANPMLLLAVAGALVLQLTALYVPPLRDLLGTESLAAGDLLIVTALSVLGYAAAHLDRILHPSPGPAVPRRRPVSGLPGGRHLFRGKAEAGHLLQQRYGAVGQQGPVSVGEPEQHGAGHWPGPWSPRASTTSSPMSSTLSTTPASSR
jgi:hypothetical protein